MNSYVRAAVGGMLLGAAIACGGAQNEPTQTPQAVSIPGGGAEEASPEPRGETAALPARTRDNPNCCAGKNECKGLGGCKVDRLNDCAGKNDCKGKGGCKNRQCPVGEERVGACSECKGMNECKGKGGCKTDSNDCAGKNECKGKGGCKFCPR